MCQGYLHANRWSYPAPPEPHATFLAAAADAGSQKYESVAPFPLEQYWLDGTLPGPYDEAAAAAAAAMWYGEYEAAMAAALLEYWFMVDVLMPRYADC